jgi:hypothetical protein
MVWTKWWAFENRTQIGQKLNVSGIQMAGFTKQI